MLVLDLSIEEFTDRHFVELLNVFFKHQKIMVLAWVVYYFVVNLQNILRNVLYLCEQFRYRLFIILGKVNLHRR